MEKMTNSKAIDFVLTTFATELPADVAEKLQNIKASIDKKNSSASGKPSKTQVENEAHRNAIIELLKTAENPMTVTEISVALGLSQNKTSALITPIKVENGGCITRTVVKKVAYFSIEQ